MANEMIHASQGTVLTQSEFEAVGLHVLNSQATGDLIYASSTTQLSRLGIGATNSVLQTVGGIPAWVTNPTIASPTFTGTVVLNNAALNFSNTNTPTIYNDSDSAVLLLRAGVTADYVSSISISARSGGDVISFKVESTEMMKITGVGSSQSMITFSNSKITPNLPTSNPGAGILWANAGIVTVGT